MTQHALYDKRSWRDREEEALLRAFWFKWKILNACGYALAEVERMVSMRHEENLRKANVALYKHLQELEGKQMISMKHEEDLRKENDALWQKLQELENRLESCTEQQVIA